MLKFKMGQMVATPGSMEKFTPEHLAACVKRHAEGDWGDLCDEDKQSNEDALKHGNRLLSNYEDANGHKLYIITEADRATTTLLLPEEY